MLMSHTSGTGDAFGFPGYAPGTPLPTLPQILDGVKPSNLRAGASRARRRYRGFEYSGGGVIIQQLALDGCHRQAIRADRARMGAGRRSGCPTAPTNSRCRPRRQAQAARAHERSGARRGRRRGTSIPNRPRPDCGPRRRDLARFAIEVQLATGRSDRVLSQRSRARWSRPSASGPYAVGFDVSKQGEGWYFAHGGSNWGFQCRPDRASRPRATAP